MSTTAMEGLNTPYDTLRKRIRTAEKATLGKIDELIAAVNECQNQAGKDTVMAAVQQLRKRSKTISKEVVSAHKDLHAPVSKFGKAIDKVFVSSEETQLLLQGSQDPFQGKETHLYSAVADYLFRKGRFPIAEDFAKMANLDVDQRKRKAYVELSNILAAFSSKNLEPAIKWSQVHKETKELEFRLHRLQFISLLLNNETVAAIRYSQTQFSKFANDCFADVKRLSGALLFVGGGLPSSPYADLCKEDIWRDTAERFTQTYCSLLGLSRTNPLAESISTGCVAWPKLLKFAKVMKAATKQQDSTIWDAGNELPIEIELDKSKRYHTIFACPVSREQSTPNNPPMRLPCGHVISKDSLKQLSRGGYKRRFKCTYCPSEQTVAEAQQLIF